MIVLRLHRKLNLQLLRHHVQASSSINPTYIRIVTFSSTSKDQPIQSATEKPKLPKSSKSTALRDVDREKSYIEEIFMPEEKEPKTTAEKVKRGVENTFLYAAILVAVVAIGGIVYFIYGEMFAADSPQTIVNNGIREVKADQRCLDLFGSQIKVYGEETGRGRRRHYAHHRFEKDGQERVRVMFHIKGDKSTGKAYAEIAKVDGTWQNRFLYVATEEVIPRTIVLIDNR